MIKTILTCIAGVTPLKMAFPTTEQVLQYINDHPGCSSKEIARHLGCTAREVNRRSSDGSYPGVYGLKLVKTENYRHFLIKQTVVDENDDESCIYTMPELFECPQRKLVEELSEQLLALQDMCEALQVRITELEAQPKMLKLKAKSKPKPKEVPDDTIPDDI